MLHHIIFTLFISAKLVVTGFEEYRCSHQIFQLPGKSRNVSINIACGEEDTAKIVWKNALGHFSARVYYGGNGCAKLKVASETGSYYRFFLGSSEATSEITSEEVVKENFMEYGDPLFLKLSSSETQLIELALTFEPTTCPNDSTLRLLAAAKPCTRAQYPAVGKWKGYHKGSNAFGLGVAELIAPRWAITAKHVAKAKFAHPNDRNVEIAFGKMGRNKAHVTKVHMAPGVDLALVQLNEAVNVKPVRMNSRVLKGDERVTFDFVGKMPHIHCAFDRTALGGGSYIWQPKQNGHNPGRAGDSGGAWFANDTLIGVISGSGSHHGKQMGRAAQPAHVKSWIDKIVGSGTVDWVDYRNNEVRVLA